MPGTNTLGFPAAFICTRRQAGSINTVSYRGHYCRVDKSANSSSLPHPNTPAHSGPDVAWSHCAPLSWTVLYTAVTLQQAQRGYYYEYITYVNIKRGTFPGDYKIPRTEYFSELHLPLQWKVSSVRAEISEFHLARPKHHSAWLLRLRPNVLPVPDQVYFLLF